MITNHRGFEPEDVKKLERARAIVAGLSDRDCCWDHQPSAPCDVCDARRAMELIDGVLFPKLEGLHPSRMKNSAERLYIEQWRDECTRRNGVNGGFGLLELILQPEGSRAVPNVSQRDAAVATTVIQWLGTTCGRCFVDTVERKIKEDRAEREEFGVEYPGSGGTAEAMKSILGDDKLHQVAMKIASDYFSIDSQSSVVRCLASSIVNVAIQWHKRELASIIGSRAESDATKAGEGK